MSKAAKQKICILAIVLLLTVLVIFVCFQINDESDAVKNGIIVEAEISDITVGDTSVILHVVQEGRINKIYLQKETVIEDETGGIFDVSVLKTGQFIQAIVNPTVLYESWISEETGQYTEGDIFYQCYKIIVY